MAHSFQTVLSREVVNRLRRDSLKQCIVTRAKIPRRLMVRFFVALHETNGSRMILPSPSSNPRGFGVYLTPVKSLVASVFDNQFKHLKGKRNRGAYIDRFDEVHFLRKKFHFKSKCDRKAVSSRERRQLKQYIREHDPLIIPHDNMENVAQRLLRDELKILFQDGLGTGHVAVEPYRGDAENSPLEGDRIIESHDLLSLSSTLYLQDSDAQYIFGKDSVSQGGILKVVVHDSCRSAFDLVTSSLRLCYLNDLWDDSTYPDSFLHSFDMARDKNVRKHRKFIFT